MSTRDPDAPWYRPLRHTTKEVHTVGLAPWLAPVLVRSADTGDMVEAVGTLAEVVVTSIDGGGSAQVQGVTVATAAGGRYFRRRASDGQWPDDTPEWVQTLALFVERDEVGAPLQRCGVCGYAAQPDGRGGWEHTSSGPSVSHHRLRLVGGVS